MTRIFISAGELSGDLHAAALTRAILEQDPTAQVFGMGGEAFRKAGGEVVFDYKEYSVMGFGEALQALPKLFALKKAFQEEIRKRKPDLFVTIDYPEFNMRVAKSVHQMGIPVFCFIPPSAWAWRRGRAKDVATFADKVACIYPFAAKVYQEAGAPAEFVGNPLVDIVHPTLSRAMAEEIAGKRAAHPLILLLPGSRKKEITGVLPKMLQALPLIQKKCPEADFVLEKAASIDAELLQSILHRSMVPVKVVEGNNYDVMSVSDVALATSGTVTLEAALCGLPTVLCYHASAFSIWLARRLVYVKYAGLPNILAGKEIFPELIQEKMTPDNMAKYALRFLEPEANRKIKQEMAEAVAKLGDPGAVKRTASLILAAAQKENQ